MDTKLKKPGEDMTQHNGERPTQHIGNTILVVMMDSISDLEGRAFQPARFWSISSNQTLAEP